VVEEEPSSFSRELERERTGLALDLAPPSEAMLITFGGLLGRLGQVPLFEFFNVVSAFGVKKAFVRDLGQCWYHRGVAGVGEDVDAVANRLRDVIVESGVGRTVLVGNSAGGYAALLFGKLLAVDEVHAFSAQTFIEPGLRERHGDDRWQPYLERLIESGCFDRRYADLRPVLERDGAHTVFHVYYAAKNPLDVAHSLHVEHARGVELHPYPQHGHRLIKVLRDSGELADLLERALGTG
jgi:pimeloyl-ACP methyl ester carboxylesterase